MATRTDFFVATTGEVLTMQFPAPLTGGPRVTAYKLGPDGKPPPPAPLFPDHPFVASRNTLPDDVADLDFVLTGERDREPEWIERDEGVGAYRLDVALVEAIAGIEDDKLQEISDEWGISNISGTIELLVQLRHLAQVAITRNEELFLYLHV